MVRREVNDLVQLLSARAYESPSKLAFRHLVTGDIADGVVEWSYGELDNRARLVAARLTGTAKPGDRALLLFAPGLDFIAAFFGCIYAGLIAVPVYPPDPSRLPQTLPRLLAIIADAGARLVLTTSEIVAMGEVIGQFAPNLASVQWLTVDDFAPGAIANFEFHGTKPDDLAFLQYTSGSTGEPKGVMVSHANIIANERMIQAASRMSADDHGVGWVPLFHDMGLIANVMQTMWAGALMTLMSPLAVLKQPMRWLRAMSHFKGTISGGPDFGYDLCARKVTPADLETLDLSHWRVAFSGAEPIRVSTIEMFS
jgi:acyl-CoA synthetase (AMP-forming)/AMP-acid ligase II